MQGNMRFWLFIMMVPFFIGVFLHFMMPLQIIVNITPKFEETYNAYKIEVQQSMVRAIAYLNSKVVNNYVQINENIRSLLTELFEQGQRYQSIIRTQIILNNAYDLQEGASGVDLQRSMWFIPGVDSSEEMSEIQQFIYNEYIQVEPFIRSNFQRFTNSKGLLSLQVNIFYLGSQIYFEYPSHILTPEEFSALNSSSTRNYFAESTLQNYLLSQNQTKQMIFSHQNVLTTCTLVFEEGEPFGSVCLLVDVLLMSQQITKILSVPKYQFSINEFYLLRPIYPSEETISSPQVITHFSSKNLSQIDIPTTPSYLNLSEFSVSPHLFYSGGADYQMNIQRTSTKTIYTMPIFSYSQTNQNQITLFLMVYNTFEKATVQEYSARRNLILSLVIPAAILFVLSMLVTTLIMRNLLKDLKESLRKLNEYCALILKDDFELQIPPYSGTCDFEELFENLAKMNQINKYADLSYFNCPKPERLIRYLKCSDFFEELNYKKSGVYQCIADCYADAGELTLAIDYITKAVTIKEFKISQQFGTIDEIYGKKINRAWKPSKQYKRKEANLSRKLVKLCRYMFRTFQAGDRKTAKILHDHVDKLMKLSYPKVFHAQYIYSMIIEMRIKLMNNDFPALERSLRFFREIMQEYTQNHHRKDTNCQVSPDILYSYYFYLKGCLEFQEEDHFKAFSQFRKGLEGEYFKPSVHGLIIEKMKQILLLHSIKPRCLQNFEFYRQYGKRNDREYIFLFDASNPSLGEVGIKQWKKSSRKLVHHIYEKHIWEQDHIYIYEFCRELKAICKMIRKQKQSQIVKKELMNAVKCREQIIYSQALHCLGKAIERTNSLRKEKIFLIFMKTGLLLNEARMKEMISSCKDSKFVFIYHDEPSFSRFTEHFSMVEVHNFTDMDRILGEKKYKEADLSAYVFE